MPTGVELYGQTVGLDETTLGRIQTGFDEIRAIEGWEEFRIPGDIWVYVDEWERDRILAWLTEAFWTTRSSETNWPVTREMHLAYAYAISLFAEWWADNPDRPASTAIESFLAESMGIPESAHHLDIAALLISGTLDHPSTESDFAMSLFYINGSTGFVEMYFKTGAEYSPVWYGAGYDASYSNYTYDQTTKVWGFNEEWGDVGELAEWPEWGVLPLILANGEHEVLSGRASYKSFGLMDGEVSLSVALDVGDTLTVARGDTPLLTGVVTNVRADLVEGTYAHEIADPVTSKSGEVEYTSGNAITAMQEAIEACGGTFETDMDTEETVFYPETPVDAWQFFRAVSYAVGGVLQYGRDGVYRLIEGGSGHSVTDNMIIGDDRPTIEERTKDYANRVAASIDQEWQTEAVENTIESYSGAGASVSITRFGEQVLIESVNFSAGEGGKQTTYSYDSNGYRIEISETTDDGETDGAEKRTRTVTVSGISEDGNQYTWSETIKTYRWLYNYGTEQWGWEQQGETTLLWKVDLEGISSVEEIEYGLYLVGGSVSVPMTDGEGEEAKVIQVPIPTCPEFVSEGLYPRYRWVATVVSNPTAGPLEGHTSCAEYLWTYSGMRPFAEGFFNACVTLGWWRNPSSPNKSYSVPSLQMFAPEDTHEVHILAKAEDPDAIDALGEYEYECQAVSLDTETGMQAFALGVLFEKGRIRHANVSVANDDYLSGDSVIWRGLEWQIDTVTVDLDRCSDIIEMVTTSSLARLQNSISREPVSWIEDVKNVVTKRTGLYDNVSRGRILSQVGFRRYLVQAEGKASPVEAKALTDDPNLVGGSVLLVRPSGKGQPWTLLSLSKEQEIAMPETVTAKVTPNLDPGPPEILTFTADEYTTTPCQLRTLSWTFADEVMSMGAEITPGDGGESFDVEGYGDPGATELRLMTIGEITPSIRPWILGVYGGKIYGTSVDLDEPIVVSEPEITDFSVDEGDILFGVAHGVNVSACYAPGMLVMVNHGDGSGYHQHEMNETGEHSHENTWYATGDYTIYAKLRFVQNNGQPWESEAEELPVTVLSNPNMGGGVVSIGGKEYISLPVGGEFLYEDSPNAIITDNDINSINVASTLSNDGVLGSVMSYELSLTLKGENINSAGHYANLYLIAPQTWYPTMDCAGGIPTEYVGCKDAFGYPLCGDYYYSCWLLNFYKAPGEDELKLWSGAWGIKNTSATWWTNHRTVSTIFAECPSSFSLPILITRSKIPGYPASQLTDRLFIDGTHVASIRAQYAWRDPFNYMTRNVPNNSSGRSFRMIAQKTGGGMSFDGNVKLWVPQQLIGYHPSIVPGGNCEFTWDKPGFTPEY